MTGPPHPRKVMYVGGTPRDAVRMIRALRLPLGMAILLAERVRADFGTDHATDGTVAGAPVAAIEGTPVGALEGAPELKGAPVGALEVAPVGRPVAVPDTEPVAEPVVGGGTAYAVGLVDATVATSGRIDGAEVAVGQFPRLVGCG